MILYRATYCYAGDHRTPLIPLTWTGWVSSPAWEGWAFTTHGIVWEWDIRG